MAQQTFRAICSLHIFAPILLIDRPKAAGCYYSLPWVVDPVGPHPERITGTPARAARGSSAVRPCSCPVAMTLAAAA